MWRPRGVHARTHTGHAKRGLRTHAWFPFSFIWKILGARFHMNAYGLKVNMHLSVFNGHFCIRIARGGAMHERTTKHQVHFCFASSAKALSCASSEYIRKMQAGGWPGSIDSVCPNPVVSYCLQQTARQFNSHQHVLSAFQTRITRWILISIYSALYTFFWFWILQDNC